MKKVKDRVTIPERLCLEFTQQLIEDGVPFDARIAVIDATPNLALHLKEAGFTNITLVYNKDAKYVESQKHTWEFLVQGFCTNNGIKVLEYSSGLINMADFDAIVGNPPFQNPNHKQKVNSMWKEFLKMSMAKSDYVSLILPASALTPSVFPLFKDVVVSVDLDVKKHFPRVGSTFCRITLNKGGTSDKFTITTSDDKFEVNREGVDFIPQEFSQELNRQITQYLTGSREWKVSSEYEPRKPVFCEDGKYEVLHTKSHGIWHSNLYHPNNDLIRVSVGISGYPRFTVVEGMGLTSAHVWTVFDTREEAEAYVEWGNSEEIQTFLSKVKWGGMNSPRIIKQLR